MKRRNRNNKVSESPANGVDEADDQNGNADVSDSQEEDPQDKRKKTGKRKSSSKKADVEEPEEAYEVEQVLDEKNIRGVRHYLIRWKGYEPESDTWEPESTLNCAELIADFQTKNKKKSKNVKKKRDSRKSDKADWDENENFEVERILDVYFKRNGQREFLVSWKGYPASQNSWEPEDNMDCKDLIKKFMSKVDEVKQLSPKELRAHRPQTDRLTLQTRDSGRRLSRRNTHKQRVQYHDAE